MSYCDQTRYLVEPDDRTAFKRDRAKTIGHRSRHEAISDLSDAAVYKQLASIHEAAVIRSQEGDDVSHFRVAPGSCQRSHARREIEEASGLILGRIHAVIGRRFDDARAYRVDPDIPATQIRGPCTGERSDSGLCCAVDAPGAEPLAADNGGTEDDRTARAMEGPSGVNERSTSCGR